MKIISNGFALLAALGLISSAVNAADLKTLDVVTLPGDRMELRMGFDSPVDIPRGYTIEQPARIALDLPGVKNKLGVKVRELGMGNARSVTFVEAADRTRMIINMTTLTPYSARAEGSSVIVVVGAGEKAVVAPVKPVVVAPAGVPSIKNLDFQRGENGEGSVVIELSDPSIAPDIQDVGGKIRLEFPKTQLPEALRVRLDVKDFATPVQYVYARGASDKSTVIIEPTGFYDYLAYQTDNKLTVSVKPLTREESEKRNSDKFAYTGEKLSLNFQDIDVRSVLQLIADFTDLNLVASDTVQGSITLRLQNVPWDQALDLVLKTKGLDQRKVGNVLLVAPADEIAARERQELETQRQLAELSPIVREVLQVNYAKACDLAKLFDEFTEAGEQKDMRGSIICDDRSNSLIAHYTRERMEELRRIVAQLDIPVRQVMIEARIVEANVDYNRQLGVEWRGISRADNNFVVGGTNSLEKGTDPLEFQAGSFVNLGAPGRTSGINIGFITDNTLLDLELSAMEKTGNGEVVSQPKVVTSDKETAKILKGTEIPFQEASSSGATTTSFKEAALSLEVTPQITPDSRVIMDVKVNKDSPDFSRSVGGVPPINTNEVTAKVLVNDGETAVIGGVFTNTQTKTVDKIPFLGDLPVVGRLFKRDLIEDSKTELLIFLTPRILNSQGVALKN
ncbi:type IV pilus assembly protein PilQ [Atopomonas hussainii]|uniref:Type IV pilus assembly protein PilQ n=1 Tax=Atopomonas hussainii TaxID=1429083 RepID=A0A1H7HSV0_9GAMM|nr:type IV pilus secretin PilQ family protein [Atopomonas hussainii]SEK53254.1 type IV pilus assembly protein PilQ [Atopomonas hussainii]